ncbi:MarR family winged helix-turn-helix transcriptional regulator [Wenjunlia tyrosinilytica]|uniref:MarR family transcriptional regulator n=1 Tax=Wenjunlia tyrosinilytica TaxID=1544741 RepID=A0A918DVV7_9ACTN|nr:MarR family winged helix-turn-helix transcriptional regulator [Wenjunlia tyrosinilytica]GGO86633.1 MarR family transcriptional regulator [Wenjunlia tyrosinilytica]
MATQQHCADLVMQLSAFSVVRRGITRVLPPDCPPAAIGVLALLHHTGDMRMSHLAERLGIDISVTSRHVAHLCVRGWIDRLPDPGDGRSRILRITPEGKQALEGAQDMCAAALAAHLKDWSDDDVAALTTLLGRLRKSFERS